MNPHPLLLSTPPTPNHFKSAPACFFGRQQEHISSDTSLPALLFLPGGPSNYLPICGPTWAWDKQELPSNNLGGSSTRKSSNSWEPLQKSHFHLFSLCFLKWPQSKMKHLDSAVTYLLWHLPTPKSCRTKEKNSKLNRSRAWYWLLNITVPQHSYKYRKCLFDGRFLPCVHWNTFVFWYQVSK